MDGARRAATGRSRLRRFVCLSLPTKRTVNAEAGGHTDLREQHWRLEHHTSPRELGRGSQTQRRFGVADVMHAAAQQGCLWQQQSEPRRPSNILRTVGLVTRQAMAPSAGTALGHPAGIIGGHGRPAGGVLGRVLEIEESWFCVAEQSPAVQPPWMVTALPLSAARALPEHPEHPEHASSPRTKGQSDKTQEGPGDNSLRPDAADEAASVSATQAPRSRSNGPRSKGRARARSPHR